MPSVLALSRAEQQRAKRLLTYRLWAHAATLLLGLLALVVDEPGVYVLGALALASEAAGWYLREAAGESHALAEEGRRRALLARELGTDPDLLGTAAVVADFSEWAREHASRWEDPGYFAAAGPTGAARLRESLQESSFWSSRLYRAAGRVVLARVVFVVAVVVVTIIILFNLQADSASEAAARGGTVVLATLITTDELGLALAYFAAARTSERVLVRLDAVDPTDLGQALAVYGDYTATTVQAPPIPTHVYSKHHAALDTAWQSRRQGGAP